MSQEPEEDEGLTGEELPTPGPPVPWFSGDVLASIFFYLFWPALVAAILLSSGLFQWIVPDAGYLIRMVNHKDRENSTQQAMGHIIGPSAKLAEPAMWRLLYARLGLWASVIAAPLSLITIFGLCCWRYGASLASLGFTGSQWPRTVRLGMLGAIILIPTILLFHNAVLEIYGRLVKVPSEEHDLVQLTRVQLLPIEWVFWLVLAIVVAPVLEEVYFRGVVQGYAQANALGGYMVIALAVMLTFALHSESLQTAREASPMDALDAALPIVFILALGLLFLTAREYRPETTLPAIIATSILFAAVHSTWPHPVALFVLSLGLGYLRVRSGSLLAPILVHALFNATSTALYFLWPSP